MSSRWFGESWSRTCTGEHVAVPVGRRCIGCTEFIVSTDFGEEISYTVAGSSGRAWIHAECLVLELTESRLTGPGRTVDGRPVVTPGISSRQRALAVWDVVMAPNACLNCGKPFRSFCADCADIP